MTAPAGWQKGSFRGVPFRTEEQSTTGGRRGVAHEFPQSDKPVWEDLGRSARRYTIDCHIVGAEYPAGANALADALDAAGAGTLIHPWLGSMQVAVPEGGWERRDSTIDGGIAWFTVEFVESGLPAVAQPAVDSNAGAVAAADAVAADAPGQFASRFSVAGATAFVENAAAKLVQGAALVAAIQGGLLGGAGPALRAFQAGLNLLGGASTLLRSPIDLALSVIGLVQTLTMLGGGSSAKRTAALTPLLNWGAELPPVTGTTPARRREAANQAAIVQLVNVAASAELVRSLAGSSFPSYEEAVIARDAAATIIDMLALRQADAGDDAGAASYDLLRRAMVRDITARGGTLARLHSVTPPATIPALVLAQRIYGDPATIEARASDIVTRNRIMHPGFVPGGRALQVLTPDGGANG